MKTYVMSLLMIVQGVTVMAQRTYNQEPYMVKSFNSANIKNVSVKTSGGSISVAGSNGSEAKVEVYINPNNNRNLSKEEIAKELANNYELTIENSGNELRAIARNKHNFSDWRHSLNISFKLYVPEHVSSDLNTSGGSIAISNLTGEQQFSTSGGSLNVEKVAGNIKGRTSGGSIRIVDARQDIDLSTSGGSIHAERCDGKIRLSTSGGSLQLANLKGNIDATTSGGSIRASSIEGEFVTGTSGGSINLDHLACSLQASTSGGGINVQMQDVGKYVKLDASAGHVDLELPANKGFNLNLRGDRVSADMDGKFNGTKEKDRVDGQYNGGGIPVQVNASSGHVNVKIGG